MRRLASLLILAVATATVVGAQTSSGTPEISETIQVTATRVPEDVLDVPASVTVIPGSELAARGVTDLAGALQLATGISVGPGGDGGPASSVPELMGLREFDAFLLVVDGVPWGGAFNPDLATLDLTNVDRIEVLRGAAPVLYGATSFVGVIQIIHRKPADTPATARAWGGSYGSFGAAVTAPLVGTGKLQQSISAGYDDVGFRDDRAGFRRGHVLWSGARETADGGHLRLGLDLTALRQDPASPHPRIGSSLTDLVPLDANQNPRDAKLDQNRFHFVIGYDRELDLGDWTTTLAVTHSTRQTIRGFLRPEFVVPPGASNADGYRQSFSGNDLYFDSHLAWQPDPTLSLVGGLDVLAGKGTADSNNFEYSVDPSGVGAPSSRGIQIDERPSLEDKRVFAGAYLQAIWKLAPRWLVDAGLRLNQTHESQDGEVGPGDAGDGGAERSSDSRSFTRLSGSVGASYLVWHAPDQALWLFADYKNAFKPAAVDFGPEAEGEILRPETARTVEGGVKGSHLGGRLTWQASTFRMDFDNLVVATIVNGLPAIENAGQQRFTGVELEGRWRIVEALSLEGSFAAHSSKFRDYVTNLDGVPTQLRGHHLEMSPDRLAALGLAWSPESGVTGHATWSHVGERYLNKRNTALAGAYDTLDAGLGYRLDRWEVAIDGYNLTDQRPPVAESELGDAQYYLLPARSFRVSVGMSF